MIGSPFQEAGGGVVVTIAYYQEASTLQIANGFLAVFGYVSHTNATMSAWIKSSQQLIQGDLIFPLSGGPDWGFTFCGVPTDGEELTLVVEATAGNSIGRDVRHFNCQPIDKKLKVQAGGPVLAINSPPPAPPAACVSVPFHVTGTCTPWAMLTVQILDAHGTAISNGMQQSGAPNWDFLFNMCAPGNNYSIFVFGTNFGGTSTKTQPTCVV